MSEIDWAGRVKRFLKAELKRREMTYGNLAERLNAQGLEESEASVANKLSRGTFPATFFLAVLTALNLETLKLSDL